MPNIAKKYLPAKLTKNEFQVSQDTCKMTFEI